jgi:hypothetical protein
MNDINILNNLKLSMSSFYKNEEISSELLQCFEKLNKFLVKNIFFADEEVLSKLIKKKTNTFNVILKNNLKNEINLYCVEKEFQISKNLLSFDDDLSNCGNKLKFILEILKNFKNEKIMICHKYVGILKIIKTFIEKFDKNVSEVLILDGKKSSNSRDKIINKFLENDFIII